jgi:hypothetical protein
MEIKSTDIIVTPIGDLVFNPKNNNKHPPEQIERLAQLIKYQGFRNPIIVSVRTGFVIAGHGRIEAAKKLGVKNVPVMFQDFDNEAQEYAYLTSDNAIASWAELDLSMIHAELMDLGPDFDSNLLGIEKFEILPEDKNQDEEVDLIFNYKLEVDCENEDKQQMLLMELQDRGFKVRVLI